MFSSGCERCKRRFGRNSMHGIKGICLCSRAKKGRETSQVNRELQSDGDRVSLSLWPLNLALT